MNVLIAAAQGEPCAKQADRFAAAGAGILRCKRGDWESMAALSRQDVSIIMLYAGGIPGEVIRKLAPSVRCIIQMYVGYEEIDVDAATERGIMVCNNPHYGTEDVAAMALSMLMAMNRKLFYYKKKILEGGWPGKGKFIQTAPYSARRLSCMTLGLIGFGNIGRKTAAMAQGLGMRVIAWAPSAAEEAFAAAQVQRVTLDELLTESDAISLHAHVSRETDHLINEETIARMKDGVFFINTARSALTDEAAVLAALQSGKIAAAGIDVFDREPLPPDHPFLHMDNVILSPHSAWHTAESVLDVDRLSAEIALTVLRGEVPSSCVNKRALGLTQNSLHPDTRR